MKNAKGQEIRWVLEKDMLAFLKETQTPEKYAEIEARHKELMSGLNRSQSRFLSRIRKAELLVQSR